MFIHLNVHVLLVVVFSLSLGAMVQTLDCQNTTEAICGGSLTGDSGTHTQYECTAEPLSSVRLDSCANGNPNLAIFWFWYDDVCRVNNTRNKHFAAVVSDNNIQCRNISDLSITQDSCQNNYVFTRQSMIIKNITNSTSQKYICLLAIDLLNLDYSSAIIYSINISGQFISGGPEKIGHFFFLFFSYLMFTFFF